MLTNAAIIVGFFLGAYFLYLAALYLTQNLLIFYPSNPDFLSYRKFSKFSNKLQTKDGAILQGWTVPTKRKDSKRLLHLIYFGGNAQEASSILPLLKNINFGFVSAFNYRGYGLSEGDPSESSLYSDAIEVYDFIARNNDEADIVIMGHSLGSAVAGHVAKNRAPKKLILSSPIHSIDKIAKERFYAPAFAVKHRFALSEIAQEINAETLVLIAENDCVIPNHHSYATASYLTCNYSIKELSNVDHNELPFSTEAINTISSFIIHPFK